MVGISDQEFLRQAKIKHDRVAMSAISDHDEVVPQEDDDEVEDHDEAVKKKAQQKEEELKRLKQVERDAYLAWDKAMIAVCRSDLKELKQVEQDAMEAWEDARRDVSRLESELMTMVASSSSSVPVAKTMPKKPKAKKMPKRSHDKVSPEYRDPTYDRECSPDSVFGPGGSD